MGDGSDEEYGESESGEKTSEDEDSDHAPERASIPRARFAQLTADEQETLNQDIINVQQLLRLDPEMVSKYTLSDLHDDVVLERVLRLLHLSKLGREELHTRVSPHIRYDKLPAPMARSIAAKLQVEEYQSNHRILRLSDYQQKRYSEIEMVKGGYC